MLLGVFTPPHAGRMTMDGKFDPVLYPHSAPPDDARRCCAGSLLGLSSRLGWSVSVIVNELFSNPYKLPLPLSAWPRNPPP